MLIGSLLRLKQARQILIVVPATLVDYWMSEIARWNPDYEITVRPLTQSTPKKSREQQILMNKNRRIVFLTTGAILCAHY